MCNISYKLPITLKKYEVGNKSAATRREKGAQATYKLLVPTDKIRTTR
jgi:hypothetical protein